MSEAMTASMNRATFALQSRLFVAMKRAGRVIDLVWFQHNPEYARAVLETATRMSDEEVQEIGLRLLELVDSYLAQAAPPTSPRPAPAVAPAMAAPTPPPVLTTLVAEPAPAPPAPAPAPAAPAAPAVLDRHMTSLR